jgi:hypothetical protein
MYVHVYVTNELINTLYTATVAATVCDLVTSKINKRAVLDEGDIRITERNIARLFGHHHYYHTYLVNYDQYDMHKS